MSANTSKISNPSIGTKPAWASWLDRLQGAGRAFLARLTPSANVRLIQADGGESIWRVGTTPVPAPSDAAARFEAREIPEALFLSRLMALPRMSAQNMESAILLEVRSHSPFAADDLASGFTVHETDAGCQVELVMASRKQVQAALRARFTDIAASETLPEVWAVAGLRSPVVLQGYGEGDRVNLGARGRRWNYALLTLAVALATFALVTPTAQLALRAGEATDSFSAIMARAAPLIRKRDELSVLNDRLRALDTAASDKVDVPAVMEYLTKALPDDTYLYSLDVKSGKVVASGHTVDASALLQRLSRDPRLRDVKSPLAVTRQPGAAKEAFTVEFTLVPAAIAPAEAQPASPAVTGVPLALPGGLPFTTGGASK